MTVAVALIVSAILLIFVVPQFQAVLRALAQIFPRSQR